MSSSSLIIDILAATMTVLLELICYCKLSNRKFIFNIKNSFITIISVILVMLNTYNNDGISRTIFSFIILLIAASLINNDKYFKAFYYSLMCFIIGIVIEILLSVFIMCTNIIDLESFDSNSLIKALFSMINLILMNLVVLINKFRSIINNIFDKLKNYKFLSVILCIFLVSIIIIDFKYFISFSKRIYFGNIVLLMILIVFLITIIVNYIKVKKEIRKTEILLDFMSKYEKIVDDNRMSRHELLNDLLMLKSIKDKKSKEYDDLIDELIDKFSNKGIKIKNIYKLPSGLKGIFYYKLYGLEELNININVSNGITSKIKKLNRSEYASLYKIIGIVLDNAIEASKKSKDKFLLIDVYKDKSIVIEVSNSFSGYVDLEKINNKDYSTKGKKRGLGLYIMKKISEESSIIEVNQSVDGNIFITKIVVKEK